MSCVRAHAHVQKHHISVVYRVMGCLSLLFAVLQYAEFLSTAFQPAEYAALLPPVAQLVNDYGVDPEVVFQVCFDFPAC